MSRMGSSFQGSEHLSSEDVLREEIPWKTYMTAKLISEAELELIHGFDKKEPELQDGLLLESGQAYFDAFMTVLRASTKEQVVRYVLALLDEVISRDPSRAAHCHPTPNEGPERAESPYPVFLRFLQKTDWFIQEKACRLLTHLLAQHPKTETAPGEAQGSGKDGFGETAETALAGLIEWCTAQLRRPSSQTKSIPAAVHALATLLRGRHARLMFHREGGVMVLAPLLRSAAQGQLTNIQLIYESTLCVWLLSYLPECQRSIQDCGAPRALVGIVRVNVKEKVTRVALFALKNMLASVTVDITADVVDAKLPRLVQIRMLQSWGDEDILPTLEWMDDKIRSGIEILSSYDKYKKEVLSGTMDWGPMHTEEQFWKQNVDKFEEKDFQVLRTLLRLLEVSREVKTLAVGCFDLGQFVTYHPHGRFIVSDLRGKEIVMELMRHSDTEVQKNALLCVQKIMLSRDKLDFLTAAS